MVSFTQSLVNSVPLLQKQDGFTLNNLWEKSSKSDNLMYLFMREKHTGRHVGVTRPSILEEVPVRED